jgi:CIC family chloride channel protein
LGIIAGLLGIVYNHVLLGALAIADRLARWLVEVRAALVGAAVGALACFTPGLVRGGDTLTQRALDGTEVLALLPFIYLLRLFLGAASYAAGTPGGLFAPLLVSERKWVLYLAGWSIPTWRIQPPMRLPSRWWAWRPYSPLSCGHRSPE